MNRILSLLVLLAFTTMAQAQSPCLPYNPDENADGLIGVSDLQGLLSLYGSEFSSAILSDNGNIAVVEVGSLNYYKCRSTCASLPGAWSIVNENSVGLILDQVNDGYAAWFYPQHINGSTTGAFGISPSGESSGYSSLSTDIEKQCFCYAKQRPRVEYSYCSGGTPIEEAFNQCINEKLSEGWYPLSGFPMEHSRQGATGTSSQSYQISYNPQTHASFWRWEQ
tara:strand:- start:191 stop:859 length:669 start_codon:yes stop_codon:yes gene_type:complete